MSKKIKIIGTISLVFFLILTAFLVYEASRPAQVSSSHSGAVSNAVVDATEKIEGAIGGGSSPNTPEEPDKGPTLSEQMRANWGKFNQLIRKGIGHFGAFAVLAIFGAVGILLLNRSKVRGAVVTLVLGISVALITEIIQLYTEGRAGSADDVILDFSGYVVGFLAVAVILGIVAIVRYFSSKQKKITQRGA